MRPLSRAVIRKAAAELDALAEGIREMHTVPGRDEWPANPTDQAARKEYERLKKLVRQLEKGAA